MKRAIFLTMLLGFALGVFPSLGAQVNITLGDGTATNTTTGSPAPYGTWYKNFREQYLVLASELNDAGGGVGNINSIAFNVQSLNNCSPMPNYRIRIKTTTQTALNSTFETGDYQQVFQANEFMPVAGWNTHAFSTPFNWNGTANLLIDIVTDIVPGNYAQNASVPYTTTGFNSSLRYQSDSAVAIDAITGTLSSNRSNMQFSMEALDITDLNAISIVGPSTPNVNSIVNYTVSVKNYSLTTQTNYTVKLMRTGGIEIASVAGTPILPHQIIAFALPWIPAVVGEAELYGRVVLVGDENPANDETDRLTVVVMEEGLLVTEIGTGTATNTNTGAPAPYGTYYKAFRQQLLYTADDFYAAGAIPGMISALAFNVQSLSTCSPMPNYTIRLKQTDQTVLSTTFELGDYTTVWQGASFMPVTGWNIHGFGEPFLWDGTSNLLVDITTDMVTNYTYNALVYYSNTGYASSLRFQSDSANGSTGTTGITSNNRSNIRFFMSAPSSDPQFAVNPPFKNFGDVVLGYTPSQAFRVMNAGGGTLTVNSVTISGSNYFSLTGLPALPAQLTLGQYLPFSVAYAPTAAGDHTATVTITDNLREIHTVALSGNGVDATIQELSYTQGFDEVAIPALPLGWSHIYEAAVTSGYVKTVTTSPQSPPNCVGIYNPTDINTIAMLIAPPLGSAIPTNNVRVKLWGKGNGYSLKVGVMTNPTDASTFTEVETLTFATSWEQYQVSLAGYLGTGKFIAFKHANNSYGQTIYLDTVEFEMMGANDLAATSISGNVTPSVGAAAQYAVSVFNNGTAAQSNYNVKLYDGNDVELATAAGTAIAAGNTLDVVLSWTPTTEGPMNIYGKVILTGDINPGNDASSPMFVTVQPAGVFSLTIGDGNQTARVPADFYWKSSLFETIYTAEEMNGFVGMITGVKFYNQFSSNLTSMPIKVWLGSTLQTDLSAGWIPSTQLTQVFDGTVDFPSGENVISITFPEYYMHLDGGNLVMMVQRPLDSSYYSSSDLFKTQTVGSSRSLEMHNDNTDYDPANPTGGTLNGVFPKTTFTVIPGGVGHISGTVSAGSSPLEGVLVNLNGGMQSLYTGSDGSFLFINLLPNTYSLSFSKHTYISQELQIELEEDETEIVQIDLQPMLRVDLSGNIIASDSMQGIEQATIRLMGYEDYQGQSLADGSFVIPQMVAEQSYTYSITHPAYTSIYGQLELGEVDYALGTIIMNEMAYAPHSLVAEELADHSAVALVWQEPVTEAVCRWQLKVHQFRKFRLHQFV